MTKNPERISQRTNQFKDELIVEEHGQVTNIVCIIVPMEFCSWYRYYQLKRLYFYHRCTNQVYINIPLLITYLSAIDTLFCLTEIEVNPFPNNKF